MSLCDIISALSFAADRHKHQRRKDAPASPYINHPIALTSVLVLEVGIQDEAVVCGALLHDTVEDTATSLDEIEVHFGAKVRRIVMELTDDKSLDKATRKQQQIDQAADSSYETRLVKLADKICNLRDMRSSPPPDWSLQRIREYYDWAHAVVDQIRGTHRRLEMLFDEAYEKRPS